MNLTLEKRLKKIRDLYRSIHDFKKDYQPRANAVKGQKGDLVTDSRSILARRRNHFSQPLNVLHGVNDVRQTEIQNAHPLVPEANAVQFEIATKKPQTIGY